MNLKPLDSETLKASIKDIINEGAWSIVLTLVGGDLLFGDFHYLPRFFSDTSNEAEQAGFWIPDKWRSLSAESRCAYKLLPVCIVFNAKQGTKHGWAHEIEIRDDLISGIRPLLWTEESVSSLGLKNVPNPIATLICNHNTTVATRYGLHVSDLVECALPESGVPPSGIEFSQDELIYVDWDFFSHMSTGPLSVGAFGFSVSGGRSLYRLAYDKLLDGTIEKIASVVLGIRTIEERSVEGFLIVPDAEITTIIEGHECIAVICSDEKCFPPEGKFLPVLLKKGSLSYPTEFLPFLNSRFVFYGEVKHIPLEIDDVAIKSNNILMARIIGYVASK